MAHQEEQGRSTPLPLHADAVDPVRPPDSGEVGSWASATPYAEPTAKVASDAVASGVAEASAQAASAFLHPVEAMLRDPLGEVARKERRSLLGISAIAILVGWTGLVPAKIENFGISFAAPERKALLWVFVAVVLYYTVAFIVYALTDFLIHRHAVHVAALELWRQQQQQEVSSDRVPADVLWQRLLRFVNPTSQVRYYFDFLVPLAIAGVAIWSLLGAVTHVATNVPSAPTAPAAAPAPSLKTPSSPSAVAPRVPKGK